MRAFREVQIALQRETITIIEQLLPRIGEARRPLLSLLRGQCWPYHRIAKRLQTILRSDRLLDV